MLQEIGGAYVRRTFTHGARALKPNERLTAAEVLSIPINNRKALIEKKYIETFPPAPALADEPSRAGQRDAGASSILGGQRHIVSAGFGKYHVIEGVKLTDSPITKEAAEALVGAGAAKPEPKQKKDRKKKAA